MVYMNVEHLSYLGNIITSHARRTRKIKSRNALAKAVAGKDADLFTSKLDII